MSQERRRLMLNEADDRPMQYKYILIEKWDSYCFKFRQTKVIQQGKRGKVIVSGQEMRNSIRQSHVSRKQANDKQAAGGSWGKER